MRSRNRPDKPLTSQQTGEEIVAEFGERFFNEGYFARRQKLRNFTDNVKTLAAFIGASRIPDPAAYATPYLIYLAGGRPVIQPTDSPLGLKIGGTIQRRPQTRTEDFSEGSGSLPSDLEQVHMDFVIDGVPLDYGMFVTDHSNGKSSPNLHGKDQYTTMTLGAGEVRAHPGDLRLGMVGLIAAASFESV